MNIKTAVLYLFLCSNSIIIFGEKNDNAIAVPSCLTEEFSCMVDGLQRLQKHITTPEFEELITKIANHRFWTYYMLESTALAVPQYAIEDLPGLDPKLRCD